MRRDAAVGVGEVGRRLTPRAGIRRLVRDILGYGVAAKLPHTNTGVAPLHGHDSAVRGIIRFAERVRGPVDAAPSVGVGAVVAGPLQARARHLALDAADGAPLRRVQRHLVAVSGLVDGLHDVDLAVVGPVVLVREPQGRPRAAAVGRVLDVEDEEAALVLSLGLHAH